MITLKSDARQLTKNAKYSYLSTNYASGVTSLILVSSVGFAADDYLLLGDFGSEISEVVQIDSVTSATHTIVLKVATKFAHSQDVKVTIIKYNQVRFYHTATTTFSATDPVTGYIDIQCDSYYTLAYDTTNTTGYGWFVFYNSTNTKVTTNSNAIPYGDFEEYSVKKIFDAFFSLLNNKEMKLIQNEDAFRWLNEGYAIAQNELNLVNPEYKVPAEWSFTTTSGASEHALPTDFSELVSVTDADGDKIPYITLAGVPKHDDDVSATDAGYFLRGTYIGISPEPTSSTTYYVYYRAKSAVLSSYYDNIELPDNNFYPLVDFMLYRAAPKLGKSPQGYLEAFQAGMNRMKVTAHKQNANKDSWGVDAAAYI